MIFVPIFKTKASAEPKVIEAFSTLFNDTFIPYLQVIKKDKRAFNRLNKIFSWLKGKNVFIELCYDISDNNYLKEILSNPFDKKMIIPIFPFDKISGDNEFLGFLNSPSRPINRLAIKLNINDIAITKRMVHILCANLSQNDYIFIDIGDSSYLPLKALIKNLKKITKAKIIVIYQERTDSAPGKEYYDYDYDLSHFKNEIIKSIKSGDFDEDGFASYCTAKNIKNDSFPVGKHAIGVLITYNGLNNEFYTVRSDTKNYITIVYTDLKNKIKDKTLGKNIELWSLYDLTPISRKMLDDEMTKKGCQAASFIKIGMSHYIEEILNNVLH